MAVTHLDLLNVNSEDFSHPEGCPGKFCPFNLTEVHTASCHLMVGWTFNIMDQGRPLSLVRLCALRK